MAKISNADVVLTTVRVGGKASERPDGDKSVSLSGGCQSNHTLQRLGSAIRSVSEVPCPPRFQRGATVRGKVPVLISLAQRPARRDFVCLPVSSRECGAVHTLREMRHMAISLVFGNRMHPFVHQRFLAC